MLFSPRNSSLLRKIELLSIYKNIKPAIIIWILFIVFVCSDDLHGYAVNRKYIINLHGSASAEEIDNLFSFSEKFVSALKDKERLVLAVINHEITHYLVLFLTFLLTFTLGIPL